MIFKRGMKVVGNEFSDSEYGITTSEATMKILKVYSSLIEVKIIDHKRYKNDIGKEFTILKKAVKPIYNKIKKL